MTTRASRANLTPKANASAKTSPKGAKPTPQTPSKAPSKAPAKASKPVAPSATKAHHAANQPGKVTAASVSAKLDAAKPSGPLGLTPAVRLRRGHGVDRDHAGRVHATSRGPTTGKRKDRPASARDRPTAPHRIRDEWTSVK